MYKHIAIAALISLGLLTACNSNSSNDADADATAEASASTQSALESAWAKAKEGESPISDCVKVKAKTITSNNADVAKAAAACNYDIPVAYFNTLLDEVDAGTKTCQQFMTSFSSQLLAMTMSMGGLKHAADKSRSGTADSSAASGAVTDALTGNSSKQSQKRIKAALAERASAACPLMTMSFNR